MEEVACGSPDGCEKDCIIEPLAIVGFSLKYPQDADTPDGFWRVLEERRDVMTEWPKDRLKLDAFFYKDKTSEQQKLISGAHFLKEDLGVFDAGFFGISATEAIAMDIQQRKLLEVTYHAFENAGIRLTDLYGTDTGVYSGSMSDDYQQILSRDIDRLPKYTASGVAKTMVANRLSWFYDLRGPSISMDSACSSSLMAFDFACQGLRNRDCSMAVVTGSSVVFAPDGTISLINMNFLSPKGRCHSFDDRADGYSRGEGFGVIILKTLSDAIRDNDMIRAVVRSNGSNQDGHTPGLTQPSSEMQAKLIRDTYKKAGLELHKTRFFEAHGTGTPLGDPIEANAIGSIFRTHRSSEDPLFVGALKANVGHLEGGSGVAGLIKTVMVLEKGIIPPNANFENLNPNIDSEFLNLKFPTESTPWPCDGLRRASIASFGFGGSNSHAILDDAYNFLNSRELKGTHSTNPGRPRLEDSKKQTNGSPEYLSNDAQSDSVQTEDDGGCMAETIVGPQATDTMIMPQNVKPNKFNLPNGSIVPSGRLLVFSASDEQAVQRVVESYKANFQAHQEGIQDPEYLSNLAYTLSERRSILSWKTFAVVDSVTALQSLDSLLAKPQSARPNSKSIFVFTGQGAQYHRMGVDLLSHPSFKATIQLFDKMLGQLGCAWSVSELLQRDDYPISQEPLYSQAMTTAVQIALYDLLQTLGIQASLVVGHSSGEIAAAYAAGGLTLDSACKVSYFRGKLASQLKDTTTCPGGMMSVDLPEDKMRDILTRCSQDKSTIPYIACINSPYNVTLSGEEKAIDDIQDILTSRKVRTRKLNTGVAYHSPFMQPFALAYAEAITDINKPVDAGKRPTMVSSITGRYVRNLMEVCTPEYWVENLLSPVQFVKAMSVVSSAVGKHRRKLGAPKVEGQDIVEVGPHSTLRRPITDCLRQNGVSDPGARYHCCLQRGAPARDTVLRLVGELFARGYPVNIQKANEICSRYPLRPRILINLPAYPFNHSRRYWHESTIGEHTRLRIAGLDELLGVPVPDWNPLGPRWRKTFDLAEMPWIEHHQVHGRVIYPAAGMIAMVIQGCSQIAEPGRHIHSYMIRDAIFTAPITIDKNQKAEVQLHMRLDRTNAEKGSTSLEFRVYSFENAWFQNCSGTVKIIYDQEQAGADGKNSQRENAYYRHKHMEAVRKCTLQVPSADMYRQFKLNGLQYGPAFQPLHNLCWDGNRTVVGRIECFGSNPEFLQHDLQPHVVHPTVLDGAGQLPWVSLTKGASEVVVNGAAVTRIKEAWVASSGLSYPNTRFLEACCTTSFKGLRGTDSSIITFDSAGNLVLRVSHMETTAVGGDEKAMSLEKPRKICFDMQYCPDVTLLKGDQLVTLANTNLHVDKAPEAFYQDLELVLFYFSTDTIKKLGSQNSNKSALKPHMFRYVAWLERQLDRYHNGELAHSETDWITRIEDVNSMQNLISKLERENVEGRFFMNVGRRLELIIQGLADPLEIMFQSGLAEDHYQAVCKQIFCCKQIVNYLEVLSQKNPQLSVLEVGAGTGSFTSPVLEGLGSRFARYDYTDISGSFFENAQQKFSAWKEKISFGILDIEKDPVDQGYSDAVYDVVVAAWVLHATSDLAATVSNVRKLLKPGGKLILLEITKPDILRNGFAFGTLPGWWLSIDPQRKWSPCISDSQWTQLLTEHGFNGVDVVFPDYDSDICHESSILIATAVEQRNTTSIKATVTLVVASCSLFQDQAAHELKSYLEAGERVICSIVSLTDHSLIQMAQSSRLVFLVELDQPYLSRLDETSFKIMQDILAQAQHVLWVTSASANSERFPDCQMIRGFARVLFTEKPSLTFTTLSFESPKFDPEVFTRLTSQVIASAVDGSTTELEFEYVERNGVLMINRVFDSDNLNKMVHSKAHMTITRQSLGSSPPLKLTIPNSGLLDSVCWEEDDEHSKDLGDDQIEIQVQAMGVNFRDLLVILGKYTANTVGCECAGIVTRIGSQCDTLRPGDRVCACIIGCSNSVARCHYQLAVKIPDFLSTPEAASLPTTGVTAYHSLITLAQLKKEDSILIHSATGGTGQMAVQIAQSIGAEVFVTVGTDEKKRLVKKLYQIPDDHIFYSRDTSFSRDIYRATDGRGVDVVLNSLSNESLLASWECIAPFGRFVELGKMDIEHNSRLPMDRFSKNVSFHAVAADHLACQRPLVVGKALQCVLEMIGAGKIKVAAPIHIYPISELETAFRIMQSGKNTGKTVLTFKPENIIPTRLRPRFSCSLDPNATYVIAGGFGGLGRSAAVWMSHRGARNLVLLSRSGPSTEAAQGLLSNLSQLGVTVRSPRCNLSDAGSLAATLRACSDMPPIKGCLQATMVLQDALFETMTWKQWSASVRSKVASTWNLHTQLPKDMSFFVMLSSVAGIAGSMGQSNYAAGNAFQDGLAAHRVAIGQKAIALDLGWMGDIGAVAESTALTRGKEAAADLAPIYENQFLALLDHYCNPQLPIQPPEEAQPIIGLVSPAQFRESGLTPPDWLVDRPLFRGLMQVSEEGINPKSEFGGGHSSTDWVANLLETNSKKEATRVITDALTERLSKATSTPPDEISHDRPLHTYGVDSLLAVELRNWFSKVFKADVAIFDITGQESLEKIAGKAVVSSKLVKHSEKLEEGVVTI